MSNKIKFVLIGCGKIASGVHIPALIRLRDKHKIEILGTCDQDIEAAKLASDRFGINKYSDNWRSLVKEVSANVVSICLPPGPNAEVSSEAAKLGLHVICEKPPGINLEQSIMMEEASKNHSQNTHMLAFNRRHSPVLTKLRLNSKKLGQPITFYGNFNRPSIGLKPTNGEYEKVDNWIVSDSIHVIDMSIAIMGYPDSIVVNKKAVGSPSSNIWSLQLMNENGTSMLNFNYVAGKRHERFEWSGNGYSVIAELPLKGYWFQDGSQEQEIISDYKEDLSMSYGFYHQYEHFIKCIKSDKISPETDFTYGTKIMFLIEKILKSEVGKVIDINFSNSDTFEQNKKVSLTIKPIKNTINKKNILLLHTKDYISKFFSHSRLNSFEDKYNLKYFDNEHLKDLEGIDIIVSGNDGLVRLDEKMINKAKNLKLVIVIGASVKFVKPEKLFKNDIMLFNTANAIAESVAEHCMLASLSGLRKLVAYDINVRKGRWDNFSDEKEISYDILKILKKIKIPSIIKDLMRPLYIKKVNSIVLNNEKMKNNKSNKFNDLVGQTVGLIGWGHIARNFARLLKPFNCNILINSDNITIDELNEYNLNKVNLGELLSTSKIISIHKGVNKNSYHFIGKAELDMLKPGTVLINTARSEIINEDALTDRLIPGDIHAFLDVYKTEPIEKHHPLIKLDNVTLTPHVACNSMDTDLRIGNELFQIIEKWETGQLIQSLDNDYISNMT